MSLPMTAVGPLKVETKPILMLSAANAEFASVSAAAPASQKAVFISLPSLSSGSRASALPERPAFLALHFLCRDAVRARHRGPATDRAIRCDWLRPMHHNSRNQRKARS